MSALPSCCRLARQAQIKSHHLCGQRCRSGLQQPGHPQRRDTVVSRVFDEAVTRELPNTPLAKNKPPTEQLTQQTFLIHQRVSTKISNLQTPDRTIAWRPHDVHVKRPWPDSMVALEQQQSVHLESFNAFLLGSEHKQRFTDALKYKKGERGVDNGFEIGHVPVYSYSTVEHEEETS